MPHSSACLLAAVALAIALPSTADAQIFGRRNDAPSAPVVNETPKCTQNLGTLTIADTQGALFGQMGLGAPSQLLRVLVRDSGCFTLIERGPGMDVVERERGRGAAGRIRTADFVLVAELGNPIQSDNGENRPGLLGSLGSVGGRALLQAGAAALMQGQGADLGEGMGQLFGRAASATANAAGGQLDQAFSRRTVDAIQTVKKDIGKGKEDAQVVFSLSSVPLAETVGNVRATAGKDDVRRLRIRNSQFGGQVGGGYETEDEGKILALAFVRGYADLVTSLGWPGPYCA